MTVRASAVAASAALTLSSGLACATDGVVQLAQLSHEATADLTPIVPRSGDAFTVRFQAVPGDLERAEVRVRDNGGLDTVYPAVEIGQLGEYAVWEASIPALTGPTVDYSVHAFDGADQKVIGPNGVFNSIGDAGRFQMNYTTLEHAPYGATPVAGGTVFKVWAPGSTSANVRGDFNSWGLSNPMTQRGDDWIAFVPGASVGQEYKFFFSGFAWNIDPRARAINPQDGNNSVIVDTRAFQWTIDSFVPADAEQLVVYQLHVPTFAGVRDPFGITPFPSGYTDVAARVQHLVDLGVNAVMLNPINEYPGERSGGYNPTSKYHLESSLGTPDDFKLMVDTLHANGIAVWLDIVWNHFDSGQNFLWNYNGTQIYYDTPQVDTPWGPQADFDEPAVREYFLESLDVWLGEYRLDGLRHDAVFEMVYAQQPLSGRLLTRTANNWINRRYASVHSVAEIYDNNPINTSLAPAGFGFDGHYHEAYKNAIYDAVEAMAFGDPDMGRLINAADGTNAGTEGRSAFNYYELHDDAWPLNDNERAVRRIDTTPPHDDQFARRRTMLAQAMTLTSRGIPAILQGTEWLEDGGWEEERLDWLHRAFYDEVVRFYSDLIGLRTSKPALFADSPMFTIQVNEGGNVLVFERFGPDNRSYVVVANFSNTDYTDYRLGLPRSGEWGVIMDSTAEIYGGDGSGTSGRLTAEAVPYDGRSQSVSISVPAGAFMLLQHDPEFIRPLCAADVSQPYGDLNLSDVQSFLIGFGGMQAPGDIVEDGVYNLEDVQTFLIQFGNKCN